MQYNWEELVSEMASRTGRTKVHCDEAISDVSSMLSDLLSEGNNIYLKDFGKFEVVDCKKKIGRNPKTNEEIIIPERKKIKFVVSKNLKKKVEILS